MQPEHNSKMKIRIFDRVLDTDADPVLSTEQDGDVRRERRRSENGTPYEIEIDIAAEASRAAKLLGAGSAKRAAAIGGRSRSDAKLAALAKNRESSDGRSPTTPDGVARLPLRKALESIFGKPLPKEGPVAKLVHKMSSGAVVRRTWPLVAPDVPPERSEEIAALVERLASVLDSIRAQRAAPSQEDDLDFVPSGQ